MKKYFLSILSALMLASSASAQFVITKTDDTKTNVDGKLTVETQGEALNQNRQEVAQTQGLAKQIVDECCYYTKIKHNNLHTPSIA